ncbi:MAG: hypothetical protein ACI849_000716 [Patiriisocius sp.]|jgi:hypothetical protein
MSVLFLFLGCSDDEEKTSNEEDDTPLLTTDRVYIINAPFGLDGGKVVEIDEQTGRFIGVEYFLFGDGQLSNFHFDNNADILN